MIKLTLAFAFTSTSSSRGSGVASACGGCTAPHADRVAGCVRAANSESCTGEVQISCSRSARESFPPAIPAGTELTRARQEAGTDIIKASSHNLRSAMLSFPAPRAAYSRIWHACPYAGAIGLPVGIVEVIGAVGFALRFGLK